MPPLFPADHQVRDIIIRSPGAMVDEVVSQCPNLSWNQVFLSIDRLSREGMVTLIRNEGGLYSVKVSDQVSLNV